MALLDEPFEANYCAFACVDQHLLVCVDPKIAAFSATVGNTKQRSNS